MFIKIKLNYSPISDLRMFKCSTWLKSGRKISEVGGVQKINVR